MDLLTCPVQSDNDMNPMLEVSTSQFAVSQVNIWVRNVGVSEFVDHLEGTRQVSFLVTPECHWDDLKNATKLFSILKSQTEF